MVIYSDIDDIIEGWARRHSLAWMKEFGGDERRFLYISNVTGESYQISLDLVMGGVEVNLYSVERFDKDDLHYKWSATRASLVEILDNILLKVEELASHP